MLLVCRYREPTGQRSANGDHPEFGWWKIIETPCPRPKRRRRRDLLKSAVALISGLRALLGGAGHFLTETSNIASLGKAGAVWEQRSACWPYGTLGRKNGPSVVEIVAVNDVTVKPQGVFLVFDNIIATDDIPVGSPRREPLLINNIALLPRLWPRR